MKTVNAEDIVEFRITDPSDLHYGTWYYSKKEGTGDKLHPGISRANMIELENRGLIFRPHQRKIIYENTRI